MNRYEPSRPAGDAQLAKLEAILKTAAAAIVTIDETGAIDSINPATTAMFGYSADELIGRNVNVLMPEPFESEHDKYLSNYLKTGVKKIIGIGREVIARRKDGSTFPMHLAVSEFEAEGRRHFAGIITDRSAHHAMQDALNESERRLAQTYKLEAIAQLAGGIAHDLNNMLAIIMSGLNLAQRRLNTGDRNVERFLDAAMDGASRAATLTGRLMAFARQQPLSSERIESNRLIVGLDDLLRSSIGQTIKLQTILSSGLWPVRADVGQLENAILNLAINARDAMPEGGHMTIETSNCEFDAAYARQNGIPEGHYVQITLSDDGIGMTADIMSKAFDPFFTTKGAGKGTGLGLSQVHGFIKQSCGHMKIYSEFGLGTTIKIYLPRLMEIVGEQQRAETARAEAWPDLHRDNSAHIILVVDDDARVNDMTVTSLRELGYTVIHSDCASSALEKLAANPSTALLFTDIVMPDVNGRQLAAEAILRFPDLKVLYTTGFARNAVLRTEMMNANQNFIAKPFTLAQLATKLTQVFAGA